MSTAFSGCAHITASSECCVWCENENLRLWRSQLSQIGCNLMGEVSHWQDVEKRLLAENERLKEKLWEALRQGADWRNLEIENRRLRQDLAKERRIVTENQPLLLKLEAERDRLQVDLEAVNGMFEAAGTAHRDRAQKVDRLQAENSELKEELAKSQDWVPGEVKNLEAEVRGLQSANEELETERDRLRAVTGVMRTENDRLQVEMHKESFNVRELQAQIKSLQEEISGLKTERFQHESTVDQLKSDLDRIRCYDAGNQLLIERFQAEAKALRTENERLLNALKPVESSIETTQAEAAALRRVLLEVVATPLRPEDRWHIANHKGPSDCRGCRIESALYGDAGQELLERLRRAKETIQLAEKNDRISRQGWQAANERIQRLEEALKFYAASDNYMHEMVTKGHYKGHYNTVEVKRRPVVQDAGHRARLALADKGKEEKS